MTRADEAQRAAEAVNASLLTEIKKAAAAEAKAEWLKEALADAKRERDEANTRAGDAWKSGYKEGSDNAIAQARKAISQT